jgi:hypothetical protein
MKIGIQTSRQEEPGHETWISQHQLPWLSESGWGNPLRIPLEEIGWPPCFLTNCKTRVSKNDYASLEHPTARKFLTVRLFF